MNRTTVFPFHNINDKEFDVWERMLGDEGEQQEEDCYHGDKDASRDPRSVEINLFLYYMSLKKSSEKRFKHNTAHLLKSAR